MYIGNDLQIAHPSYKIIDDISSGFNGSTTSFALQVSGATPVPFPISTQQVMISVNGVVQEPDPTGSAGFKLLGSNIVFSSAPANGHAFFGVINAGADYVTAGSEFPDGSVASPSFTFQDDQDTGWFRSGSGAVGYSANGVQTLTFDGNGLTVTGDASFVGDSSKNLFWDKSDGALEFADNAKAVFGAASDLQLFHDGNHSYVQDAGTGDLYLRGTNSVIIAGTNTGQTLGQFIEGDGCVFRFNNTIRIATTNTGATVTGRLLTDGVSMGDNEELLIGTGNDFKLRHDGTDNHLVSSNGDINIQVADSENAIIAKPNGAVELYHDNVKKLQTTSSGVTVTGTLITDVLTIYDSTTPWITVGYQSGQDHRIQWDSSKLQLKADPNNDGNNSQIILNVDNSDKLVINKDGEFGIGGNNYGTAGQVLTSGGTGSAVSWADAAGGGEVEAVASGTLPNGTAVILNSDGTVSKAGLADPTFNSAQTPKTTSCDSLNCVHFDTNLIGIVYRGGGGDMEVIGATVSNHTLTFGTAVTRSSMASNIKCAMNSDNTYGKRCGVVWHSGNYGNAKFTWFVVNANRTITFSQDDTAIWNGEAITYLGIGPSTGGGREWNVSFVRNGDGTVYVQCHGSSSNGNDTPSSRRTVSAGGRNPVIAGGIGMSATNGLIAYTKDSDDDLYVRTIQGSGGSSAPTIGSETKIYTGTVAQPTGAYQAMIDLRCDPKNHGSYLIYGIAFRDTSSNKLYLRMLKVASGASSLSTFDSDTNHEIASHQGRDITLAFDRENRAGFTPNVHVAYMRTDDGDKGYLQSATFNGTTVGSFTQAIFQTADMNTAGGDLLTGLAPTGSTGDMVILYKDPTSGGDGSDSLRSKVRVGTASNVQANNVLGFSTAAYTNGQTAKITVIGGVSENQSSLTTGSAYYVKQDGTLGTSAESPRAGVDAIALSATKILVKL